MLKTKAIFLFIITPIALLFITASCDILSINQKKIDEITVRFDNDCLTQEDKVFLTGIYKNMIFFGKFFYPEASAILEHYIFGDGSDLYLVSDYFKNSAVVQNTLVKGEKTSRIGPVTLKISDDPRIAYAINGFWIEILENDFVIYQYIDFDKKINSKNCYTTFNLFFNTVQIPDRLIRVFEESGGCKAFTVYIN